MEVKNREAHNWIQLKYSFGSEENWDLQWTLNMAASYDGQDSVKNSAEANAKDTLLEALLSKNCSDIETILLEEPALVNFVYEHDGKHYGTPLLIACSSYTTYMREPDEEDTGMLVISFE